MTDVCPVCRALRGELKALLRRLPKAGPPIRVIDAGLSVRARNVLYHMDARGHGRYETLEDVAELTPEELACLRGCGAAVHAEIVAALTRQGLFLKRTTRKTYL